MSNLEALVHVSSDNLGVSLDDNSKAPKAWAFRRPRITDSYLATLLVVLNSKWAANSARWRVGEIKTALAPAPVEP